MFNLSGNADVIIDVAGYYEGGTGKSFHPLARGRVLDLAPAAVAGGPYATPWTGGLERDVSVGGLAGVPSDAEAVVLNVTVTATTGSSFLTIWPAGVAQPTASSLNWTPGVTIPNAVTVKVGTGGGTWARCPCSTSRATWTSSPTWRATSCNGPPVAACVGPPSGSATRHLGGVGRVRGGAGPTVSTAPTAGAVDPQPWSVTATPTTFITDGQPLVMNVKTSDPNFPIYSAEAHVCRSGITYHPSSSDRPDDDFRLGGDNCPLTPISSSADSGVTASTYLLAPTPGGATFSMAAGVGVVAWTSYPSGVATTLTCDSDHPCTLVVELQAGNPATWIPWQVELSYQIDDPVAGSGVRPAPWSPRRRRTGWPMPG